MLLLQPPIQLSLTSSVGQKISTDSRAQLCRQNGDHRFGITLAMQQSLCRISTNRLCFRSMPPSTITTSPSWGIKEGPVVLWPIHTHTLNGPLSGTIRVSRYQKGKTNLDFTEARDSERQWYQLDYMQVCTSLQTDNHASTPPLSFLQAGCPSCCPTNSVKAPIYVQKTQVTLILSPEKWTRTMLWIVLDGESW